MDSEMDQQREGYLHSEPSIVSRGSASTSQPNIRTMVAASGTTTNVNSYYLQDAYDNTGVYGLAQYNGIQPQPNLDMGGAAAANINYSNMNPFPRTGIFTPSPLNHRASDQMPGSSTFATSGGSSDSFGRNNSFMDDVRGPYKRKIAEGVRGNQQYFNASASPSIAPPNAGHADGIAMDTSSFSLHMPSLVEVGQHGSGWNRSGESMMVHGHNHVIRGNYLGQHFLQAPPPWFDQQLNNDGHTTAWSPLLPMPYMQAPNVIGSSIVNGSSLENASMGLQRYHDTANNRHGIRLPHPPPANHPHHNYYHPALPVQGVRGQAFNFHPPVPAASFRVPTNPSRGAVTPPQTGFEMIPRHVGPVPSASLRIYRPHRAIIPNITLGHRNLPPMGFLRIDAGAVIDAVGNLVDDHRDMRLDIEDMSYEDLLALGEQIGQVSTGLSEETITAQLKTKTYLTPATAINLEVEASDDQESDSCMICQDEYKDKEKIGVLRCEHEYHADCLTRWLLVKNVCPICKSEALTPKMKDREK